MRANKIMNFHIKNELKPLTTDPNVFTLRKRNKFTRWILNIMKRFKIVEERVEYSFDIEVKEIRVDLEQLHNFLYKWIEDFKMRGIIIERVLLGRSQYEKFIEGELDGTILNIPYNDMTSEFMGARVLLNPFIDGIVFVPREKW